MRTTEDYLKVKTLYAHKKRILRKNGMSTIRYSAKAIENFHLERK